MAIATICASLQSSSSNDTVMSAIEAELRTQGWDPRRVAGLDRIPPFRPDIDPPNEVTAWADQLDAAEGVAIATPEYAAGPPDALKNALDWLVSATEPIGKPVLLVCGSPGGAAHAHAQLAEVLLAEREGCAILEVTDNGVGIEPAQLKRIFDPFFTTKQKGTGLGLAISRQIVEELGGELAVESQPGVGTRFTVRLPLLTRPAV